MIEKLKEKHKGATVVYKPKKEKGKIKNFDNDKKIAWVVYKVGDPENWENEKWKNYTAASTKYEDLELKTQKSIKVQLQFEYVKEK